MKILVVQDHLRSGGTERQSVLLANAFSAGGHATTLLTFRPGGVLSRNLDRTVSRHVLQPFDTGLDFFAPGLIRRARQLAPDVVLCMGRMANCYAGRLQAALPQSAVIGTMRTGKKIPRAFQRSLQRVRHVVANSRDARDLLVTQHGVSAEKISVIHNSLVFPPAAAVSDAAASRAKLRSAQRATDTTFVMLSVAMFRPEKGQRELIEIVSALPADFDWQLWFVGDGATRTACEKRVAELDLGARIKFLGFQRDPGPLYAAADCAVHASSSESLSNFLIEAQAHGLPAIAMAAQGIEECFLPGQTGWAIPRGDYATFRDTIRTVARVEPDLGATRSALARDFARATFDPTRQVGAYLELFSRLLETPPRT